MRSTAYAIVAGGQLAAAFPFIARMPGVDTSLLRRQQANPTGPGSEATCPYNPNHVPAPLVTDEFPYNSAKNGLPGKGIGGLLVPDPNDPDHQYIAPKSTDIRGPCPGLNTAANHGFIARDGITTYNELVDMTQNAFNMGWDVGNVLAILSVPPLGDMTTQKLSIGCDATSRTSFNPGLTGAEPGLDGHNKFESDASLTRNDYFLADGDNYDMNGTLFGMMIESTGGVFDVDTVAKYRYERYEQSLQQNPNFYYGPSGILLYAAAAFLYNIFPSGTTGYKADTETIATFWGAHKESDGTWSVGGDEQFPANWTARATPLHIPDVAQSFVDQYIRHPILFGGNTGNGFDAIDFGNNGEIKGGSAKGLSVEAVTCLLYQMATERIPSSLDSVTEPIVDNLDIILTKINPAFENLGCPLKLT